MKDIFKNEAMNENNPKWENVISRVVPLDTRRTDIRSPFDRDYTRIIHSNAYRRLKHKTQVFFSPENDHICTRIEHVTHVESISYTIASYLGLNTELTKAISVAHDLGHSPFGHEGERIELLEGHDGYKQNLDLTYGVRDGIISHCGEIDENSLKPREEFIDLNNYNSPSQYAPYTWEACIVKISDKISYIGRDIEDAITLGILDNHLDELYNLLNLNYSSTLNNSIIINELVRDLCENSSPEKGLCFSKEAFDLMNKIKEFNYKHIYLNEIYNKLLECFDYENTFSKLEDLQKFYPKLGNEFYHFLINYCDFGNREELKLKNRIVFNLSKKEDYIKAIIAYISGMTDNFAMEIYNELISF